jgi:hypothetical protein
VHSYAFTLSEHVAPFLQGFGEHSLMFVAHVEPVQPGSQLHEAHLKPQLVHEPCTHGFVAKHQLTCVVQVLPVHPLGHGLSQLYALAPSSTQVPRIQGFGEQSFMSVAHVEPVHPDAQVQVYAFTLSVHVAPFSQGFGEHSLLLMVHVDPSQSGAQVHVNPFTLSEHVPLFLQGFGEQSLMLLAHVEPSQPDAQVHVNPFTLSEHVPLLSHGFGEQSLMLVAQVEPE